MSLREYVRKRDFTRTREPAGKEAGKKQAAHHRFVIQKHAASHLHYDFRLEMDGTLKSWAVPKGVPYARSEKRLAMQVEDHPIAYAGFEGIIPKGEYGGGTVMVWDQGTYEPLSKHPLKDLEGGKLHFFLHGKKLNGEWILVRLRRGDDRQWLLMKGGENNKPVSKKRDDESAISGRTMAQIAGDRDAEWHSGRKKTGAVKRKPQKTVAKKAVKLKFIEPMKARFLADPPRTGDWVYELKFDGYRALALKNGDAVQLLSRNEKDLSGRFPDIVESVKTLPVENAILDGEIVALDPKGRSSFQLLQAMETGTARPPIVYYLFDLLTVDGKSFLKMPLAARKKRLGEICAAAAGPIRYSGNIEGSPGRLLAEVRKHGLEGIIGKRSGSHYEPGARSGAWIKLKCVNEQEFVIGGFTPPGGTRTHFGALLVGYYERGKLHYCGKVGTGFNHAMLLALHRRMKDLPAAECPFANLPEKKEARWGQSITVAQMKRCTWVKPQLVCQVKFAEWTRDAKLRQPVFLGLREDKLAHKVIRERPKKTAAR